MMMKDPYETLGVARTATKKDIKDAFRKLTRKHHPDLNPDDPEAAEKFGAISAAHDLLADPETRRRFDAGEIDASGAETGRQRYYRDYADAPGGGGYAWRDGGGAHARQEGFASNAEFEDFLSRVFGGGAAGRRQRETSARGADVSYTLEVSFLDAATGATRAITLPDGKSLKLTVPEGARDRQTLRLKGQGMPGFGGGPAGDAYVELHVAPHAFFERRDDNIHVEIPVTLQEAVLGGAIEVPTIHGPVSLTVPPGSNTGKVLRLRNKGIQNRATGVHGHQMVRLKVVLPEAEDPELTEFLRSWRPKHKHNPREEMLR